MSNLVLQSSKFKIQKIIFFCIFLITAIGYGKSGAEKPYCGDVKGQPFRFKTANDSAEFFRLKFIRNIINFSNEKLRETPALDELTDEKIPSLENLQIYYEVWASSKRHNFSGSNSPEMYRREIRISKLTAEKFNALKEYFGDDKSMLQYQSDASYKLEDFLPPSLQAAFELREYNNCFGLVSDYLNADSAHIRIGSSHDSLIKRMEDKKFFRRLEYGEKLKSGDVVFHVVREMPKGTVSTDMNYLISHAVIYLADNISISANPWGMYVGRIMPGYAYRTSSDSNEPVDQLFANGVYLGGDGYSIHLVGGSEEGIIVYRRTNSVDRRLSLIEPQTSKHWVEAAYAAFTIQYDNLGRARVNRNSGISCIDPE